MAYKAERRTAARVSTLDRGQSHADDAGPAPKAQAGWSNEAAGIGFGFRSRDNLRRRVRLHCERTMIG